MLFFSSYRVSFLLALSFLILAPSPSSAFWDDIVAATVETHENAGINIEQRTGKITVRKPAVIWYGKDPKQYTKNELVKIDILASEFNNALARASYFQVIEGRSLERDVLDVTLEINEFSILHLNEDGYLTLLGRLHCSLKIKDGESYENLGSSKDLYQEHSKYERAVPVEDVSELPSENTAIRELARDVSNKLVKTISPTSKTVLRKFAAGGNSHNAKGIRAAVNKNWKSAFDEWNEAIHQDNTCHQAYFNKGILYEMNKQPEKAYELYETAYELAPDNDYYSKVMGELDRELRIQKKYKTVGIKKKELKEQKEERNGGF